MGIHFSLSCTYIWSVFIDIYMYIIFILVPKYFSLFVFIYIFTAETSSFNCHKYFVFLFPIEAILSHCYCTLTVCSILHSGSQIDLSPALPDGNIRDKRRQIMTLILAKSSCKQEKRDNVIKWKHFPRHWPCVRVIHWSPVSSPNKGYWRGALMFPLVCVWTNGWVNGWDTGDFRLHHAHYHVTVMLRNIWESRDSTTILKIKTMLHSVRSYRCRFIGYICGPFR